MGFGSGIGSGSGSKPVSTASHNSEEMREKNNPQVFLDISIYGAPSERIVIELFADFVPKTAENFRALCTGEKGLGHITRKPLHYKGTEIHIFSNFCVTGGNISPGHSNLLLSIAGESIYGGTFEDENLGLAHNERGLLFMSNAAEDNNGSTFAILLSNTSILTDGKFVVFGKLIEGMEILNKMEPMVQRPRSHGVIKITDCGEIPEVEKRNVGPPPTKRAVMENIKTGKANSVLLFRSSKRLHWEDFWYRIPRLEKNAEAVKKYDEYAREYYRYGNRVLKPWYTVVGAYSCKRKYCSSNFDSEFYSARRVMESDKAKKKGGNFFRPAVPLEKRKSSCNGRENKRRRVTVERKWKYSPHDSDSELHHAKRKDGKLTYEMTLESAPAFYSSE